MRYSIDVCERITTIHKEEANKPDKPHPERIPIEKSESELLRVKLERLQKETEILALQKELNSMKNQEIPQNSYNPQFHPYPPDDINIYPPQGASHPYYDPALYPSTLISHSCLLVLLHLKLVNRILLVLYI